VKTELNILEKTESNATNLNEAKNLLWRVSCEFQC